jgi:hypothetical protein
MIGQDLRLTRHIHSDDVDLAHYCVMYNSKISTQAHTQTLDWVMQHHAWDLPECCRILGIDIRLLTVEVFREQVGYFAGDRAI